LHHSNGCIAVTLGGYSASNFEGSANHPGITLGYRLTVGEKVLVYISDTEPFGEAAVTRHLSKPPNLDYLTRNADLLIYDAQYTPQEYVHRHGLGHSSYLDALQLAQQARAKHLVLFHHDPNHTDADIDNIIFRCRSWQKQQQVSFICDAAAEDNTIVL
jgi:ribonuclease BN (tRNA processing enzyme)